MKNLNLFVPSSYNMNSLCHFALSTFTVNNTFTLVDIEKGSGMYTCMCIGNPGSTVCDT